MKKKNLKSNKNKQNYSESILLFSIVLSGFVYYEWEIYYSIAILVISMSVSFIIIEKGK